MIVYDAFGCQASFPFNFVPLPGKYSVADERKRERGRRIICLFILCFFDAAIVAIPSVVNATCFGGGDGEVWISASGGMATFTYSVSSSSLLLPLSTPLLLSSCPSSLPTPQTLMILQIDDSPPVTSPVFTGLRPGNLQLFIYFMSFFIFCIRLYIFFILFI